MKKIFVIISAITLLSVNSCKKGLEPKLYGILTTTNFPVTEADYTNYTLAVYTPFQSKFGYPDASGAYQNDFFSPEYGDNMDFDYGTDICNIFTGYGGFFTQQSEANYTYLINQSTNENQYEKIRFITKCTLIIGDLAKSSISDATKTELTAEARMARGWAMYFLLQLYGPTPAILDPALAGVDNASIAAQKKLTALSRADYVASIAGDLNFAATNLPVKPAVYGRFNQGLALTVLMKLYMNEKDFTDAEKVGRQIMNLGYSLVTDYQSLFEEATEDNTETIWAVVCIENQDGALNHGSFNWTDEYTYPLDYPGHKIYNSYSGGDAPFSCTWAFYNTFDPADKRRIPLIASYTNKSGGITNQASGLAGPVIAKYPDLGGNFNSLQGNDMPRARLGQVMLYLAEAINQNSGPTSEAIGLVNQVRAAHGGLGPVPAAATTDKPTFDLWLLNEEGWDTYFEGDRKMDLIRHGQYNQALTSVGKTPGPTLWPVPSYELIASGGSLKQNPGY